MSNDETSSAVALTVELVATYVSHHTITPAGLIDLLGSVHGTLTRIEAGAPGEAPGGARTAATPAEIKRSITADHLVCLEDGKRFKSLKRHLRTRYGMSPAEYRQKWGLPHDYPMVAPRYAARRSELAKGMGLGKMRGRVA